MVKEMTIRMVTIGAMLLALGLSSPADGAPIYSQDFETGYVNNDSIGVRDLNDGQSDERTLSGAAFGGSTMGWQLTARGNNNTRYRGYDNAQTFALDQGTSFTMELQIRNAVVAGTVAGYSTMYVGLFDSTSTANSLNGERAMKHSIGLNIGGFSTTNLRIGLNVDASAGAVHNTAFGSALITDGWEQWFKATISYNASTRLFTYQLEDQSSVVKVSDSYTLPGGATFSVDVFGMSNAVANDFRQIKMQVDNVTIIPEPASLALGLGGLLLLLSHRKK